MTTDEDAVAGLTVLVVDDAPDMRLLARVVLEKAGLTVLGEAAGGREALHLFRRLKPPHLPRVILLDHVMSGLTGIEAARHILAENPDQLIALFSAFINDGVEAEAKELGVAACVPKLRVNELPAILRALAEASIVRPRAG